LGFAELWDSLLPLGRDPRTGGYRRQSFAEEHADRADCEAGVALAAVIEELARR